MKTSKMAVMIKFSYGGLEAMSLEVGNQKHDSELFTIMTSVSELPALVFKKILTSAVYHQLAH